MSPSSIPRALRLLSGRLEALPWRRRWHLYVMATLGVVYAPLMLYRLVVGYVQPLSGVDTFDYNAYYQGLHRFLTTGALYDASFRFIYPPPAVALFLPLAGLSEHDGYALFAMLTLVPLLATLPVAKALYEEQTGARLSLAAQVACVALTLGCAPTLENAAWGQVNTIVLLLCVLHLRLVQVRRPLFAGVVLAVGFWLKMYPAVLLGLGLFDRRYRAALQGFVLGAVAIPVALLPLVSPRYYAQYFAEVVPHISHVAKLRLMNQSLAAAVLRAGGGRLRVDLEDVRVMTPPMRLLLAGLALGSFLALCGWYRRTGKPSLPVVQALLLCTVPVFSPLGWAYTYLLALPLALIALLAVEKGTGVEKVAVLVAIAGFLVPVQHVFPIARRLPMLVEHALYSRYLVVVILLTLLVLRVGTVGADDAAARPAPP